MFSKVEPNRSASLGHCARLGDLSGRTTTTTTTTEVLRQQRRCFKSSRNVSESAGKPVADANLLQKKFKATSSTKRRHDQQQQQQQQQQHNSTVFVDRSKQGGEIMNRLIALLRAGATAVAPRSALAARSGRFHFKDTDLFLGLAVN